MKKNCKTWYAKAGVGAAALALALVITTQQSSSVLAAVKLKNLGNATKVMSKTKKTSPSPSAATQGTPAVNSQQIEQGASPEGNLDYDYGNGRAAYHRFYCTCHCNADEGNGTSLCPATVNGNLCETSAWYHFDATVDTNCGRLEGNVCEGRGVNNTFQNGVLANCWFKSTTFDEIREML